MLTKVDRQQEDTRSSRRQQKNEGVAVLLWPPNWPAKPSAILIDNGNVDTRLKFNINT